MNLNDITLGQAKELASMFSQQPVSNAKPNIASPLIGKYVIARCYSAGVHAGEVVAVEGENVVLKDSRRLWSWKAQDGVALSGVAQNGIRAGESKLDVVNPMIYLCGVCELIPTSDKAKDSINGAK